jgi:DNA-binding NarL/FixJ family response regulator
MNILLIEDDAFKAGKIRRAVEAHKTVTKFEVARSVMSGIAALTESQPDLLLLDMSLTTYDLGPDEGGGRPRNFGGIEIFEELVRLELELPVIVITQFETFNRDGRTLNIQDIRKTLKADFPENFRLIVYFDVEGRWVERLSDFLEKQDRKN